MDLTALIEAEARVSRLPWNDGDGYSWGGAVILTIGDLAVQLGKNDEPIAREIARRWNAERARQAMDMIATGITNPKYRGDLS